jgi:hypothetical protein
LTVIGNCLETEDPESPHDMIVLPSRSICFAFDWIESTSATVNPVVKRPLAIDRALLSTDQKPSEADSVLIQRSDGPKAKEYFSLSFGLLAGYENLRGR